ncbi:MAG: O-antigen ligase family protein [Candidatus Scalindua sp.]
MHEINKPRIGIPTVRLEYRILILAFISMFILIILISGDVVKLIVLASLPICVLSVLYAVDNPKRVFWVCLFVLPFIPYNWGIGISYSLPNIAPQRFLFLLIWLTYLLHRRKNHSGFGLSLNFMDMLLIFLFIWLGISMFIANPLQGAYFRWPTRGITIFLLFLVGKEMIKTTDDLWTVITIFAAQGLIMGAIGIIEAFTQFSLWVQVDRILTPSYHKVSGYHPQMLLEKILRIKGPFNHPVPFGQYLAFLLPFCVGIMLRKKVFGIVSFIITLLALILTQTRAGYVAVIVSFVVFLFVAERRIVVKVLGILIPASAIIAFCFSPYLIDLYEKRVLTTVRSDGLYHSQMLKRINSPAIILKTTMKESPLFGFGFQRAPQHDIFTYRKAMAETSYAVWGGMENGIPYALGLEIYFGGIMIFMAYLTMHYKKRKYADKYRLSLIFLTAFTAGVVTLHIQCLLETLPYIIIVFAGVQSVYYHERKILKSRNNGLTANARE